MDSLKNLKEKSKFATADPYVFISIAESDAKPVLSTAENEILLKADEIKNAGNARFQTNKYDAAIVLYSDAIENLNKLDKKVCGRELAICYQNRAVSHQKMKRQSMALSDATKAIEMDETYVKAYVRRARVYLEQKKCYNALDDIMQACILERFRNGNFNKIAAELNSALELYKLADHAKDAFEEMRVKDRSCHHCIQMRFGLSKKSGIFSPLTVPISSDAPIKGYARAMVGLKNDNIKEILEGCKEEVSKRGPYNSHSQILQAYVKSATSSSVDTFMELLSETPSLKEISLNKHTPKEIQFSAKLCTANIYNRVMMFSEAKNILSNLEMEYPQNPLVYVIKSGLLHQLSATKPEFFSSLCHLCRLMPNFSDAHFQKAMSAFQLEKNDQGAAENRFMKELKDLVMLFPKEMLPRVCLISKSFEQNNLPKMKKLIKEAQRDIPEHADALCGMKGLIDPLHPSVTNYFKRAIKYNPEDTISYKGLFNYYETKSFEYAKALEVANKALSCSMDQDTFTEFFNKRQKLLHQITIQNFWDKL